MSPKVGMFRVLVLAQILSVMVAAVDLMEDFDFDKVSGFLL